MEVRPGWRKQKRESLLAPGTTEVAYLNLKEDGPPWAVVADHTGVQVRGESPKFTDHQQLDSFAWVVADAMREHFKLRRGRIQVVGDNEINAIR